MTGGADGGGADGSTRGFRGGSVVGVRAGIESVAGVAAVATVVGVAGFAIGGGGAACEVSVTGASCATSPAGNAIVAGGAERFATGATRGSVVVGTDATADDRATDRRLVRPGCAHAASAEKPAATAMTAPVRARVSTVRRRALSVRRLVSADARRFARRREARGPSRSAFRPPVMTRHRRIAPAIWPAREGKGLAMA